MEGLGFSAGFMCGVLCSTVLFSIGFKWLRNVDFKPVLPENIIRSRPKSSGKNIPKVNDDRAAYVNELKKEKKELIYGE